jgi:hypothetical protein
VALFKRNPYRHLPPPPAESERYSFNEWVSDISNVYTIGGNQYVLPVTFTQSGPKQPPVTAEYLSLVSGVRANAPLFSVVDTRARLFSEAEFTFKDFDTGRTFDDAALRPLQEPWPNGTTGDFLRLLETAVSCGGSSYTWRDNRNGQLRWLRPDWVTIVLKSSTNPTNPAFALDWEIVGYIYEPVGVSGDTAPQFLPVDEVAHWTPIPDPVAPWRGMSWISPIVREVMSDGAATDHKLKFFEHGATPNLAIKFPESITNVAKFKELKEAMEDSHAGTRNAWKSLYLAAGADVVTVGTDLGKLDFSKLQGGGEVRIAVAGGVPASVLGMGESLKGSSLNAGNFSAARRIFSDLWARPQWRSMCAAHAKLVNVPEGARLWYNDRNIAFLREDQEVEANMQQTRSGAVMTLINAGYEPDAAVEYVMSNDPSVLVGRHTGLLSVQLQEPGTTKDEEQDTEEQDKAEEPAPKPGDNNAEPPEAPTA